MAEHTTRRTYAGPNLQKRERLFEVTGQSGTTSGAIVTPKGGCFPSKPEYVAPTLQKREKLTDVTGVGSLVSGTTT